MRHRWIPIACCVLAGALNSSLFAPSTIAAPSNGVIDKGISAAPGEHRANVIFDDSTKPLDPAIKRGAKADPAAAFKLPLRPRTPAGRAISGLANGASSTLPDPEVLGFAQSGEVEYGGWSSDFNFSLLSTIAYAFVNVQSNGGLVQNDSGWQGMWSSSGTSMINTAHAVGVRVVVSLSDHGSCGQTCANALLSSPSARQNLTANVIALIRSRGIDGVNLDFEDATDTSGFTALVQTMRTALQAQIPQSGYLSVDTFASAYQGGELWDLPAIAPYVDAIMPMAYDLNYGSTLPNAPLNPNPAYGYTDVGIVNGFMADGVPASEILLGVPYYGYVYSTTSEVFNAPRGGDGQMGAVTYSGALADFACTSGPPDNLVQNWAPSAASPWAAWRSPASGDPCGGNHNSYRELYYDNAQSLEDKYGLVNGDHLRGIGIWALGYDSGSNDLWNAIAQSFSVTRGPVATVNPLPATETAATFQVCWTVQGTSTHSVLWVRDGSGAWGEETDTTATCTTFSGHPGHSYGFYVQTFDAAGLSWGGPGSAASQTTAISSGATPPAPFAALYAVDGYGLLHAGSSPALPVSGYWPGWNIVRGIGLDADGLGGQVVDGFGGLHPFGNAATLSNGSYWPGWDIVRGLALETSGAGGYILDGFGGVHPFGDAPAVTITGYWPGWNIARAIALIPGTHSGYVLDGFGGIHPFAASGTPMPPVLRTAYWPGWDIARSLVLSSGGTGGYTMDGWGGIHPFGSAPAVSGYGYWRGWDIARSLVLLTNTSGYQVDGFGGIHAFGGAPPVSTPYYWPGRYDIRALAIAP